MQTRPLRDLSERFLIGEEIGRGSIGIVHRANDVVFDRQVAAKIMRPELVDHRRHRPRFLREAAICGRLVHPNIVPVIDVGHLQNRPTLVMSLLAGRSLRTLLRLGRMGLGRMLAAFNHACNGVAFAHSQGIVHRDIKPAHIFVGDYGQVVLTDWGLAKELGEAGPAPTTGDVTRIGDVVGTPAYMAPEQAEGRLDRIDHRADIYALGAILYEILTGTRPYEASRATEVLLALRRNPPEAPSDRAPHRAIPPALEAVCLRAMARDPRDRFDSALDLAANLESFFDAPVGARPRDRVSHPDVSEAEATVTAGVAEGGRIAAAADSIAVAAAAARALAEGRAEAAAFARELDETRDLRTQAARLKAALPAFDAPRGTYDEVWAIDARGRQHADQAAWHLHQGVSQLEEAAADLTQAQPARARLAELYRDALRAADEAGDRVAAGYFRAKSERYDDGGLSAELAGRAALSIVTSPPGVAVEVRTLDLSGPLWQPGPVLLEGTTPLSPRTLGAARLHVRLTTADGLTARLPLRVEAGANHLLEVELPPSTRVPPGFVFVAGGRYLAGADDHAPGAEDPHEVEVAAFCVARHPVTWEAWFEFLEDRLAVNADVSAHLPRFKGRPLVVVEGRSVRWRTDHRPPAQAPVRGLSHQDARAYAAWLARRLGARIRLPTEHEWAFAAGAGDGRAWPWGDAFVPGAADTRRPGQRGPSPVNAYPDDESPYGMRAVAGGVREWTSTPAESEPGRFLLRGGSWRAWPDECRIGNRATGLAELTHPAVGIRLAADVVGAGRPT